MYVIKLGGSEGIDVELFLDDLATLEETYVLVHGANAELDALSRRLGIEPRQVSSADGQMSRFTDRETMDLFLMVYAGRVNKRIVEGLAKRGRRAAGLTGLDAGTIRGRRKEAIRIVENGKPRILRGDFAGSIETVDTEFLTILIDHGITPVLCPPAISADGEAINVDGDKMAMEVAVALGAEKLLIFSNTRGLLRDTALPDSVVGAASLDELDELLSFARGRMKKKVLSCGNALRRGVEEVILADARVPTPVRRALAGAGTHLRTSSSPVSTT
ncbi:MAG TPA: [LysW]-aminoadipate kinase [Chloroflexota bacterium]|jgi:acetylglutamate/LysW-gamma-L-alpha-aminoadipate kinase|nr:[LysW]-aminoadipate kinase [Chloroflexota bacterium]